jgi:hypothetical protein
MTKSRKLSAVATLGSLTAAVALLAGSPDASAQVAPGGGSFPGSFLVPGTNTSVKIGGFAKVVGIYDMGAAGGDTVSVGAVSLRGSAAASLHGATRFHARQSNINIDTRTPTAYGDLTTFVLFDAFGQNTSETQNASTTQNARLVYAYGTLGPFLAGQWVSLWADTDAIPESVDPTGFISVMDGLTNRAPQFRYTFAAPGGFSAAVSVENPEAEGRSSTATTFTTSTLSGIDRYPNFVARARIDQAWGHLAATVQYRDMKVEAPGVARFSKSSYGGELSGHLNTFGKDALKATAMAGRALGHYMSDLSTQGGLQADLATGAVGAPNQYGVNVGYTHWWTAALRSSVDVGYSHSSLDSGILTTAAAQNGAEKRHTGGRVNLIWSPVPQVDLGIEYDYARRVVWAASGTTQNVGTFHRLEVESVFKF